MEAAQGEDHESALQALSDLAEFARKQGWEDARFLAELGEVLHGVVHAAAERDIYEAVDALVSDATARQAPSSLALALSLRALLAAGSGRHEQLFSDAAQAVALADDEALPALDRCMTLVVCAAAYNTLSLWELVDELYDRAAALAPLCEEPIQQPAIAANRVLIRLEWATGLLEAGQQDHAAQQLFRAGAAVGGALRTPNLPDLWELDVRACGHLLELLGPICRDDTGCSPTSQWLQQRLDVLAQDRRALVAGGDIEVTPLLDGFVAWALLRAGMPERAADLLRRYAAPVESASSGAALFPAWVNAHVLAATEPSRSAQAALDYAGAFARARWTARTGVLAAARSRIAGERMRRDHARLSREVLLDPLTGLGNRRAFDDWCARSRSEPEPAGLLVMDVDRFKKVNDVHGHAVGDQVLRTIGRLITEHVRAGDLAVRLGGDEFAIVFGIANGSHPSAGPGAHLAALRQAGDRLARDLQVAVDSCDWSGTAPGLSVTVSAGSAAATLAPSDLDAPVSLFREADMALYAAKAARDGGAPDHP